VSSGLVLGGLLESSFGERLTGWLERARASVGADVLAVADLDAAAGQLAPAWRASAGRGAPSRGAPALGRNQLQELTDTELDPTRRAGLLAEIAQSLGVATVEIIGLEVTPRLIAGVDAHLVAGFASHREASAACLGDLKPVLEAGLSADRRARLAETVLEAVDQAPDAIELTDREARLFYANTAWERRFGYHLRDVAGRTVGSLFRDPAAPLHDAAFYRFTMTTLASGRSWLGVIAGRNSDGRRVMSEVNVGPFTAERSRFRGNVAVRRDVGHREQRDEALAVAHHEFSNVLSAVPDGVAVLREGKVYFANAALLQMLQLSESHVVGRAYVDLIHPDDRERFESEHRAGVTRVRLVDAQGLPRFAEISTAGNVSYEGEPAMIVLSRDTTDYEVARQRLAHADKLAAVGSLASGIAHEINNPLAFLTLNLESVRKSAAAVLPTDEREAIDDALDGARRIRQIVGNLNAFARADQGGPAPPVDVEKAITSALGIAENEVRHRLRVERDHEPNLGVAADEGQLVQVLVNVLVNAAQAARAGDPTPCITVRTRRFEARVEIVLADTGVGIPSSILPRVFEPFFSARPLGKGTGLGLAIAKQIVHSAGGRISIASELNKGTTVTITLPRAELPAPSAGTDTGPGTAPAGKRRARILIVDDENAIASSLRRSLADHLIETVAGAPAALRKLSGDPTFDVVLCDLMMPEMTGPELYRRVCIIRPGLRSRFIFMTGGAYAPDSATFIAGTGCVVLEKPFDVEKLERSVQEVAGRPRPLNEDDDDDQGARSGAGG
jgi:PAS domain S-box-containing protein